MSYIDVMSCLDQCGFSHCFSPLTIKSLPSTEIQQIFCRSSWERPALARIEGTWVSCYSRLQKLCTSC